MQSSGAMHVGGDDVADAARLILNAGQEVNRINRTDHHHNLALDTKDSSLDA